LAKADEPVEKIFEDDEMELKQIRTKLTREQLLRMRGIFFLKDIAEILEIDSTKIKKRARALMREGNSPWEIMGVRKIWNHWFIRMKVFAPYYRKNLVSRVRDIPAEWNPNILLSQRGIFYLSDVCRHIPFTPQQLRYQAKTRKNARTEMGIWKDEELGSYLVDMSIFGPFIRKVWVKPDFSE